MQEHHVLQWDVWLAIGSHAFMRRLCFIHFPTFFPSQLEL